MKTHNIQKHQNHIGGTAVAVLLLGTVAPVPVLAGPQSTQSGSAACLHRVNNTTEKLLECVTLEGVRTHQLAFQRIADANEHTRSSETPGYQQSAMYVAAKMKNAGYKVTVQPFQYKLFYDNGGSTLNQTAPNAVPYVEHTDFAVFNQSDPGDVTALVQKVGDIAIAPAGPDPNGKYGCNPDDFIGFQAGNIALIQRGNCGYVTKATNAAQAHAVGVIIFQRGDAPAGSLLNGTVGADFNGGIPVFEATYALGAQWWSTPGLTMNMFANVFRETETSYNVLGETRSGNPNNVVMVGASLASAYLDPKDRKSPGINANGSGSAAILETALQMAKVKPRNLVRFAWWGANQEGYGGASYYLSNLSVEQLGAIALYLNFDTLGSPNYVRFINNGSGLPDGSVAIQKLFEDFYTSRGVAFKLDDEWSYWNNSESAIFATGYSKPVGGVTAGRQFTKDSPLKTTEEAAIFGGKAGQPYDDCYGQACDTYRHTKGQICNTFRHTSVKPSPDILGLNADAVAYATLQYAMDTSTINGEKGKVNLKQPLQSDPAPATVWKNSLQ